MKRCVLTILIMLTCLFVLTAARAEGTLTLPTSLDSIEAGAFMGDTSLGRVIVPDGTTRIESKAFANSSVTEITLPGSITFIATDAFDGCGNVVIGAKKGTYAYNWAVKEKISLIPDPALAKDFEYELKKGKITITDYLGSGGYVVIPDKINGYPVTSIGAYTFTNNSKVTRISIPDTVTKLGPGVFYNCQNLTAVYLSSNIHTIESLAFSCCASLKSIDIPSGVTRLDHSVFSYCLKLSSINIPEGVTFIGNNTFQNCQSLINITLPKTLTSIDHRAFVGCKKLAEIVIPENVASIGNSAFSECNSLQEINVSSANNTYSSCQGVLFNKEQDTLLCYPAGNKQSTYVIPDTVVTIGDHAFEECNYLTNVTIPEGVLSIGYSAFWDCSRLTNIPLPSTVKSIGEAAFGGCESLTSIIIPNGVKSIKASTFEVCTNLTSITIPSSVTSIGDWAFDGCSNLTIYGKKGSYAQKYAKNEGITFVAI